AMSRHPAAGVRATVTPLLGAAPGGGPEPVPAAVGAGGSFATVAALLTGPWRVNDPVGFSAAMRAAPLVAGHPVVDLERLTPPLSGGHPPAPGLGACARQATAGFDPLSAAVAGRLESAGRRWPRARGRAGPGRRPGWVSARCAPGWPAPPGPPRAWPHRTGPNRSTPSSCPSGADRPEGWGGARRECPGPLPEWSFGVSAGGGVSPMLCGLLPHLCATLIPYAR